MKKPVANPEKLPFYDFGKLPFYDLEKLHKLYENAYGHFSPKTLAGILSPAKVQYIGAIKAAYQTHPQHHIQAVLF